MVTTVAGQLGAVLVPEVGVELLLQVANLLLRGYMSSKRGKGRTPCVSLTTLIHKLQLTAPARTFLACVPKCVHAMSGPERLNRRYRMLTPKALTETCA